MRLGSVDQFALDLIPVSPSWERRYPPERIGWAGLSLWVKGVNLCRHSRAGENELRDVLYVPLLPLADWLVRSWAAICFEERPPCVIDGFTLHEQLRNWGSKPPPEGVEEDDWLQIREAWFGRHFLGAGADGAFLPNVGLGRDGDLLVVSCAPARFASPGAPVFAIQEAAWQVRWDQAFPVYTRFLDQVRQWIETEGLLDRFPWASARAPLALDGDMSTIALEFFTARPAKELENIAQSSSLPEALQWLRLGVESMDPVASPLAQAIRDLPPNITDTACVALRRLHSMLGPDMDSDGKLSELRTDLASAIARDAAPEEAGQGAAQIARTRLGMGDAPLGDVDRLLSSLSVRTERSQGGASLTERMVTGCRHRGSAAVVVLDTPRTRKSWGWRFETIRALGHLLLDAGNAGNVGAASSHCTTPYRRRRAGAFAAEFLLPETALERAGKGRVDVAADRNVFQALLSTYGVGARTAAHQLYNRGWLSSRDLRDALIDELAAREDL